jgi:hypothetical protein
MVDQNDSSNDESQHSEPAAREAADQAQQAGHEANRALRRQIPHAESGEARWVRRGNLMPETLEPNWTRQQGVATPAGERIESIAESLAGPPSSDQATPSVAEGVERCRQP